METETSYGSDIPLAISASLLRRLEETARPCVRMVLEGTSASVGAPPAWLERASDVRTLGFSEHNGKSVLHVKAPKLGDAVPEIFDQPPLWPGIASQDDTAVQLIGPEFPNRGVFVRLNACPEPEARGVRKNGSYARAKFQLKKQSPQTAPSAP